MGGPGGLPPVPPGMATRGGWKKNESESESKRRSVYIFVRRNTRCPMLEAFDMPDTHESCGRRAQTISPTQSLDLLNNDLVVEWSRQLAERVANDSGVPQEAQVDRAFKLALARAATPEEQKIAADFFSKQTNLAGGRQAALADFCHMLMNSN